MVRLDHVPPASVPAPLAPARAGADVIPLSPLATRLLRYLSNRLKIQDLRYVREPALVSDGWETSIYHFQLQPEKSLPAQFQGPLTLRLFAGSRAIPQGRHYYAAQCALQPLGYPVPAPILWEERCDILGGPMLLMEHVPGPTLLQRMLSRPLTVFAGASQLAEMQTRLHQLPTAGFPCPPEPLLERSLRDMHDTIERYHLSSLRAALQWLQANRPDPPDAPCIVHLDFHPRNLIYRKGHCPVVLDWDTADVGDPHADVATTLMFLRCVPNVGKNAWERFLVASGRALLEQIYLFACRRRMELDDRKLAYYQAWAVLRRLCRCCQCLIAGPQSLGVKLSWTQHVDCEHLANLCAHFKRISGVAVTLDEGSWTVHPQVAGRA